MLFHNQVHHERDGHGDAANADEPLDELVALLALQKAAEIAADPGAAGHQGGNRPVDFPVKSKRDGAHQQEHVGE